jgi:hypothetical protein
LSAKVNTDAMLEFSGYGRQKEEKTQEAEEGKEI